VSQHPWHDVPGPDAKHDPRPGAHAPLVLDARTCFLYRRRAGLQMQNALFVTRCQEQFADACAVREEFDIPEST
jgi:hypothetical protein